MSARRRVVAILPLLCLWACSQTSAPVPSAPVPMAAHFSGVAGAVAPALKYFNTPTQGSWPEFITRGPEDSLWFTEYFTDKVGRITSDGTMTEFLVGDDPEDITEGADGNLWVTEPGADSVVRMTPQGVATTFQLPGAFNPSPRGITAGPDGNVWFTEFYSGYIDRITPLGAVTRFAIPVYEPYAWDITTGPDGDLWFSESNADAIGRFNPKTDSLDSSLAVPTQNATPWGILLAPDKHIWFTERTGNKIAEVVGSKVREFKIAQYDSYPEKLAPGSDGNLWFTESNFDALGRINPATGKFGKVVELPTGSIPNGIASGKNRNIFFTIDDYTGPSQIGEVLLR